MKKLVSLCLLSLVLIVPARATILVQNFWHTGEDNLILPSDSVGSKPFTDGFGTRTVSLSVHAPGSTASLQFSNSDGGDYMNTLSDAIPVPSDNWVFELWVNPTSTSGGVTIATLGSDTGTAQFGMVNGNFFFGEMNITYGDSSQAATQGKWTHLAWVRDGGANRFFVDGVEIGGNADGLVNNGRVHLAVKPGGGEIMQGFLDEIRFSTFAAGEFNPSDLLVNAVPEPSSTVAALCAVAGLLGLRRRPLGQW